MTVLPFKAPPKTMKRQYNRQSYTVTYVPETRKWLWEVETVQTVRYRDVADTPAKAFRAAEKHIDAMSKIREGSANA
jgi:hypothetical protein